MGSHRRQASSGFDRGVSAACAAVTVLSAALGGLSAQPAAAAPHDGVRAEVDRLYREAEKATEAYDQAGERVERLRRRVRDAQDRIARHQQRVNTLRDALGSVAGAQYRSGGVDPALALLLTGDADDYLDKAATLDRIGAHQAVRLRQLRQELRRLAQERAGATLTLADLDRSRTAVAAHRRAVQRKLARARQLLNTLSPAERRAYHRATRSGRGNLPADAGLPKDVAPASARAAVALAAVRSALGRPYVWGANGPSGFDCSGLMQWAYAQAGVHLPRTSQEQRLAGRRIPLSRIRPGDLVVYRSDASHIGMYVGRGRVIHAPYPGASVRYDPLHMMPVLSVTRV
ncbi:MULTISPECIES: C40 family peptidase [Streptomyces]|uniref:C40 family peptidase n=1 Tax=Streptomyces TaxID=1883 RepID=UPI00163BBB87|nr:MULTISPECIES: C40 family peptidase [Streptomyces]MCM3265231.1 NlpC/P60 family protein [Streptomyces thermoviolaceus]WTD49550.1 NlpC/P60 family protein [Streptomyces thermoviolaceus]